jgi:diadenylate cyclase
MVTTRLNEFAQLDGAFIITSRGVVEAAGRCITVDMSKVNLPGGMGSRHSSVAGITQVTKSIGVVVSQSGGLISIFKNGKIVYTIRS